MWRRRFVKSLPFSMGGLNYKHAFLLVPCLVDCTRFWAMMERFLWVHVTTRDECFKVQSNLSELQDSRTLLGVTQSWASSLPTTWNHLSDISCTLYSVFHGDHAEWARCEATLGLTICYKGLTEVLKYTGIRDNVNKMWKTFLEWQDRILKFSVKNNGKLGNEMLGKFATKAEPPCRETIYDIWKMGMAVQNVVDVDRPVFHVQVPETSRHLLGIG